MNQIGGCVPFLGQHSFSFGADTTQAEPIKGTVCQCGLYAYRGRGLTPRAIGRRKLSARRLCPKIKFGCAGRAGSPRRR